MSRLHPKTAKALRSGAASLLSASLLLSLLACPVPAYAAGAEKDGEVTILFTHDTHDYLYPTETIEFDEMIEHGGAAKLKTLLDENLNDRSIYLDAGDFAMGTLHQASYAISADELRNLGIVGCSVTTFGNHEFDYGLSGVTDMLNAAIASGDPLPAIVQSNLDFTGDLTEEQQAFKETLDAYGWSEYTIREVNGLKLGIIGLMGYDGIECTQADVRFTDFKETAKRLVPQLEAEGCDLIIALSHAGTSGDGVNGEDFDLAKEVPGIDIIISGHSHTVYDAPIKVGNTYVVSGSCYLRYLGKLDVSVSDGVITDASLDLLPIDHTVQEDPETLLRIEEYKSGIEDTYLRAEDADFDDIVAYSPFTMMGLEDMYRTHQEYPLGNLIADSYLYEARQNGITDVDVALVGLGTIRGTITEGPLTTADVFEICSLGVGSDGSAGHPLVSVYATGKDIKLLTELDASLGEMVSSIKMSYAGLSYTFDPRRIILDRVVDVKYTGGATPADFEDDRMYRVVANMYAVNMLGMLNGLTKGILSITPTDANGNPIDDFYEFALKDTEGNEIKEWIALKHYLESFDVNDEGISTIPLTYSEADGRKVKAPGTGRNYLKTHAVATDFMQKVILIAAAVLILIVLLIALLARTIRRSLRKRKEKVQQTVPNESAPDDTK